jgi:Ca2+-binding RTX toxin-like protein
MAIISGGGGPDTITTTTNLLNPLLLATVFADSIAGLGGADSLAGGLGNDTLLGGDGNDTLDGEGDDDRLDGGADADLLRGGTRFDTLLGGTGNDTLAGGGGLDSLHGGDDDDSILIDGAVLGEVDLVDGGLGRDTLDFTAWATLPFLALDLAAGTLRGGFAANVLLLMAQIEAASLENAIGSGFGDLLAGDGDANLFEGRGGADTLQGGTSDDTLRGGAQNDSLDGGSGNDSLDGGTGEDTIQGGEGIDRVSYGDAAGVVSIQLNNDIAIGFGAAAGDWLIGVENLDGSAQADDLWGSGATAFNHLRGGGGNDDLFGGFGDTLEGGSGADGYYVTVPGVTVLDDSEAGVADTVFAYFTYELPDLVENLTLVSTAGAAGGFGNGRNNRIDGNGSANILAGLDGDDTLDGGGGADVLVGGAGFDLFMVDNPRDVVVDEPDAPGHVIATLNWVLGADLATLTLVGPLARTGTGNARDNGLLGSDAANRMLGQAGADTVQGGPGNDVLRGGTGNDRLEGGIGRDTLYGDAGGDTLVAGSDNAALSGGGGNDVLIAGAGSDLLAGGGGADEFRLQAGLPVGDRVADFSGAGGDRVVVSGTGLAPGALDPLAFVANASGFATAAAHRLIYETDRGRLWFDADGSAGAETRILVATFTGEPGVTAADIVIG